MMYRVQDSEFIPMHPEDTWNLIRDLELRPIWDETVSKVQRDDKFLYYVAPLFMGWLISIYTKHSTREPAKGDLLRLSPYTKGLFEKVS